jgi:hypothetical protein
VYPHLENRIPVLAVVLSFVVGAAYWALVSASRTAVARQIALRRAPARGSRASGRPTQLSRS